MVEKRKRGRPRKEPKEEQITAPPGEKLAWTIDQVAEMFGVSRRTVWRWIHEGHLKPWKQGKTIRIFQNDLYALVQSGRHK